MIGAMTFAGLVNGWSRRAVAAGPIPKVLSGLWRTPRCVAVEPARGAFTAGYPRTNKLGRTVLYGKYLGFVVYLATELGHRLRLSGRLGSAPAGTPPAHAAIGVGLTALRFKEDGRT
jgi:hypothetical protein